MEANRAAIRTEIAAAVILMAAAILALVWIIPSNTEPATSDLDIAPAFFPMLAASIVLALAAAMIAVRVSREVTANVDLAGGRVLLELAIWGAAGGAIWFALPVIGFIPVSVVVLLAGGFAVGFRDWRVLVPLALVFPVVIDVGAWHIFTVDLP